MIIIYYRDASGKIVRAHQAREGQTMADIAPLVVEYNASSRTSACRTATATEVPDDSLEAYLLKASNERKKWDQEAVQDAIEVLQQALSAVRGLEG